MKTGIFLLFLWPTALILFLSGCDSSQTTYAQPTPKILSLPIATTSADAQLEYTTVGSVVSDRSGGLPSPELRD